MPRRGPTHHRRPHHDHSRRGAQRASPSHAARAPAGGVSPPDRASERSASLVDLGRMAQAGCAPALDRLLRQVEGPMYRFLLARLRAAPDAEDLARDLCQEALIRAVAAIPRSTFASDGRLLSWGLTIARNVLLDHLRQARGRAEVRGETFWTRAEAPGPQPGEEAPPVPPLERLTSDVLAELSEETAELLRLRLVAGRSWKEVAEALKIAESAAKRRYQRAQAALRKKILARMEALPNDARRAAARRLRPDGAAIRSPCDSPADRRRLQPAPGPCSGRARARDGAEHGRPEDD